LALESDIENWTRKKAKAKGWLSIKMNVKGHKGRLDTLFGKLGTPVFIEFKQPGKYPTELQYREIERWRDAGFFATWPDH